MTTNFKNSAFAIEHEEQRSIVLIVVSVFNIYFSKPFSLVYKSECTLRKFCRFFRKYFAIFISINFCCHHDGFRIPRLCDENQQFLSLIAL
jgi:hypothetical protein